MRKILIATLLGLGLAGSAQASVLTYEFSGRINLLFGTEDLGNGEYPGSQAGTRVRVGDAITGWLRYDTATPLVRVVLEEATYQSGQYSNWFEYTIVPIGQNLVSNLHSSVNVGNNVGASQNETPGVDLNLFDSFSIVDPDTFDTITLRAAADVLDSMDLPAGDQLARFNGELLAGWTTPGGGFTFMTAEIFNLQAVGDANEPGEVPEPATGMLLLGALGLAYGVRRRA